MRVTLPIKKYNLYQFSKNFFAVDGTGPKTAVLPSDPTASITYHHLLPGHTMPWIKLVSSNQAQV